MRLTCIGIVGALAFTVASTPSSATAGIVIEPDGSIAVDLFADGSGAGRLVVMRVNPLSGAVSIVSSETVGSGPILLFPSDIAVEGDGSLVTVHSESILRIDPSTGDRSVLSDATTGAGPALGLCSGATVRADGTLFVSRWGQAGPAVLKVAPATGDRTLVSDVSTGEGPPLAAPRGLAVEDDGDLVVADYTLASVVRVDPATGDRSLVSGPERGSGPVLRATVDVAVEAGGGLVVADAHSDRFCLTVCRVCSLCMRYGPSLMQVDPASGDRTLVSGGGWYVSFQDVAFSPTFGQTGDGLRFLDLGSVAVENDQAYLVESRGGVMRVDADTGRRRMVARLEDTSSDVPPLADREPERVHEVAQPRAWLRKALGPHYDSLVGNRTMMNLLEGLSPAQRRAVGRRLYAAVWQTMRDALGENHPEVRDAARGLAGGHPTP